MTDTKQENTFELKLDGDNAFPSNFSINELYYLLADLQEAIKADVDEGGDKISLSLVELTNNCVLARLNASDESQIAALKRISSAVSNNNIKELPYRSVVKLNSFKERINKKGIYDAEFRHQDAIIASINKNTVFDIEDIVIVDTTTIYGEVTRVGGSKPIIRICLLDGTKLSIETNKETAKKVSNKLYTTIGLFGEAKHSKYDYELLDFKIFNIVEYEHKNYSNVLKELRDIVGNSYDNLDIKDILLRD